MGTMPHIEHPSDGSGSFARRLALYAAAGAAPCAAGLIHWAAVPVRYDSELSWVQIVGTVCLWTAACVTGLLARRLRRAGRGDWAVVALGAGVLTFCAWRELELDAIFFKVHLFSIAYLFKPADDVPTAVKIGLGIPAVLILLGVGWWLWRHRRAIRAHLKPVLRNRFVWVLVAGGVTLVVAQVLDRADSWERRFGLVLPGAHAPEKRRLRNVEELLELAGAVWMLCAAYELRVNLLRRRDSRGSAGEPAGGRTGASDATGDEPSGA
ncbi:MAG: hypothetical protein ACOC8F_07510 [Planctomycetota bacterium]